MKLILLLFVLLAFQVNSQTVYHSSKNCQATWNNYTGKWDYAQIQFVHLTFTVQGRIILVNDEAQSTYTLREKITDKEYASPQVIAWNATDEKYRKCLIKLVTYDSGETDIIAMYDDILYEYMLDKDNPSGLDKLNDN